MIINQKCVVSESHPHHPNRVGYFQFFGEGASKGVVVLADKPKDKSNPVSCLFAVSREDITS